MTNVLTEGDKAIIQLIADATVERALVRWREIVDERVKEHRNDCPALQTLRAVKVVVGVCAGISVIASAIALVVSLT